MAKTWINSDETAKQMLTRVLKDRPLLHLPPPLHRVPLGVNTILEITGPSPSAKTEILLHVAVNCILPKTRNNVQYGGLEHSILFFDLDCRFDIHRLSQILKLRITEASKMRKAKDAKTECDETDVFNECMKRFLYTRCYDSFEFLSALKVLNYKLTGNGVYIVMIDNIGAFQSIDRGFSSLPQHNLNRKKIGVQTVFETIVQELKKLVGLHSMIVLATKTVSHQVKSSGLTWGSGGFKSGYREYMPLMWQSFVTRRIVVRCLDERRKFGERVSYSAEWLLPALSVSDEFVVCENGIKGLLRG